MPTAFCHNCSLRLEQEDLPDISDFEEMASDNLVIVKGENSIFIGYVREIADEWKGKDRWKIALELLIDLRDELL